MMEYYTLKNGVQIPKIALGTWQSADGNEVISSVKSALECGYLHIDTASAYGNERGVGQAIHESAIERDKIFVTTKVWNNMRGYENTMRAFEQSLERLGLDYIDLYLIHWPATSTHHKDWRELNLSSWQAMIDLYKAERVRAIGVSNFMPCHLEPLLKTEIPPMVNQIEFHIGHMQAEIFELCQKNGILVEAWSPLGTGKLLKNELIVAISEKYGISPSQLCVRWCLQNNTLPLPKSTNPTRILENASVFDFEISSEDMELLCSLENIGYSGHDPNYFD